MIKILKTYRDIFYSFFIILLCIGAILLFGFLTVTPLWFTAVKYKTVYNIIVFIFLVFLLCFYIFIKLKKNQLNFKTILKTVLKIILCIAALSVIICAILLAANGFALHSAIIGALILAASGIIKFYCFKQE